MHMAVKSIQSFCENKEGFYVKMSNMYMFAIAARSF